MRSKELCVDLRDKIVSMHKTGEGYKKISAALEVPRSTVVSIIRKWKTYGTTDSLPRSGRPSKPSNRGQRAMVRQVRYQQLLWMRCRVPLKRWRAYRSPPTPPRQSLVEWPYRTPKKKTPGSSLNDSHTIEANTFKWKLDLSICTKFHREDPGTKHHFNNIIPTGGHDDGRIVLWEKLGNLSV